MNSNQRKFLLIIIGAVLYTFLFFSFYTVGFENNEKYIWEILTAIGTVGTGIIALWQTFDNRKTTKIQVQQTQDQIELVKKQLQIEQEPYVVIYDTIPYQLHELDFKVKIKNIGRGLAKNIQISYDKNTIKATMHYQEPSSLDLGGNEHKENWIIDQTNLEGFKKINIKEALNLYISYYDQNNNRFITVTKLQKEDSVYKVMSNEVKKF